jgi:hypothetical protein
MPSSDAFGSSLFCRGDAARIDQNGAEREGFGVELENKTW